MPLSPLQVKERFYTRIKTNVFEENVYISKPVERFMRSTGNYEESLNTFLKMLYIRTSPSFLNADIEYESETLVAVRIPDEEGGMSINIILKED